jgi:UDP-glucose-4-epimerase GalE
MPNHVIVTGGAGYIGSHVCKALASRGVTPVTVDNLSRGHREAVRWGPLEVLDLCDAPALAEVFARYRPIGVLHFAGVAYVSESVEQPALYFENNVSGSLSLLSAMRTSQCRALVFSSTCSVYGAPTRIPIVEAEPLEPINPYGRSKRIVEQALREYDAAYAMRSVSLRYFNAGGADPDLEIGERHDPEPHLIPRSLDVAAGRLPALSVWGADYETPDGTCIRDYVHVVDLAEAHIAALEYLQRGGRTTAVNLGAGAGHSVLEIARAVEEVTGRPVRREFQPRRPGDPPWLVADARYAQELLGWCPRHSDLRRIIGHAWAWYCKLHDSPEPRLP